MAALKQNQYDAYKNTEINTANQGKLIVMLYDGAIRFLKIACDNMQPRTYDVVNNNILKSQDILTELMLALNMEDGGEIAKNLFNLYAYMKKRLLEANIAKDTKLVTEVVQHLELLKGAWEDVATREAGRPDNGRTEIRTQGASFSITG